jgi:hypothetical protein
MPGERSSEMRNELMMSVVGAAVLALAYPLHAEGQGTGAQPGADAAAPSISGKVQQYMLSPHGEVEGLLLADGTVVQFPPHLGATLVAVAKPGDAVTATGFLGPATSRGRGMRALTISNTTSGRTVVDEPPASRPAPPEERGLTRGPLTVNGIASRFLVNPAGDVDGLVLAGGEEVKFRPGAGLGVVTLLDHQPGQLTATGLGTHNGFGTVLEADAIIAGNERLDLR